VTEPLGDRAVGNPHADRPGPSVPAPLALCAAALAALLAISCAETSTGPPFTHTVHRTTAIVVHDSLGAPAGGAEVRVVAKFDSAGIAPVVLATTDAAGVASVVLAQGAWGVHGLSSGSDPKVAGAEFIVQGFPQPETDTIVVRITLHTPSVARGHVLLGSGAGHRGTIVGCPPAPPAVVTDSSGAFVLDLLPLGRWTITMFHPGFRFGLASINITRPGDTLTVADVHLDPGPQRFGRPGG
jgi:hypothetical protein